jgi:RNA polymerase sigma factor (sigma-70 family)
MNEGMERSLEGLLARLHQGDEQAADAIYRTCEPYLRLVVRRHLTLALRTKMDSLDVVQSVWVQLVHEFQEGGGRFTSADHLLAYLVRSARNRLIDRYRRHHSALRHEQPLQADDVDGLTAPDARPSQNAEAEETWRRIQALCSPGQAAVVQLRRQGLTIDEIGERTGFHPSSVRRILYDLARQLGLERKTAR